MPSCSAPRPSGKDNSKAPRTECDVDLKVSDCQLCDDQFIVSNVAYCRASFDWRARRAQVGARGGVAPRPVVKRSRCAKPPLRWWRAMGIECRRCCPAGRRVPGDWSADEGQELAQLPRAQPTGGFVAGNAVYIPCDVARGWPGKRRWQGFPIDHRMNSRGRDASSVGNQSWRGTSWRAARLRARQERLDAYHLASAALRAVAQ